MNFSQTQFGIGSLACFDSFLQVGEGAYGYVYMARDKRTNECIALKRLILHKESAGFPLNAVREVKFLRSLHHKNLISLKEVVTSKGCEHLDNQLTRDSFQSNRKDNYIPPILETCGTLYLAFEYVENDLSGLLDAKVELPLPIIKCLMKQLFEALEYLHERKIVHRDIKPANLLITNRYELKLADFGMARSIVTADGMDKRPDLSCNVVTLWYRPPEILLGSQSYNCQVDVWSAISYIFPYSSLTDDNQSMEPDCLLAFSQGCVLAEIEYGKPLFTGRSEADQLEILFRSLGIPTEEAWSGVSSYPNYDQMIKSQALKALSPTTPTGLKELFANKLSPAIVTFLERILVFDPNKRSSAKSALENIFFMSSSKASVPEPHELEPIATGLAYHEFQTKKRMKLQQQEKLRQSQQLEGQLHQPEAAGQGNLNSNIALETQIVVPLASLPQTNTWENSDSTFQSMPGPEISFPTNEGIGGRLNSNRSSMSLEYSRQDDGHRGDTYPQTYDGYDYNYDRYRGGEHAEADYRSQGYSSPASRWEGGGEFWSTTGGPQQGYDRRYDQPWTQGRGEGGRRGRGNFDWRAGGDGGYFRGRGGRGRYEEREGRGGRRGGDGRGGGYHGDWNRGNASSRRGTGRYDGRGGY